MFNCSCHHYCYRCSEQLSQPQHVIKYSRELEEFLQKPTQEVIEQYIAQINIEVEETNSIVEESSYLQDYFAPYPNQKKRKKHKNPYPSDVESTSEEESSSDFEADTLAYIDNLYKTPASTSPKFKAKEVCILSFSLYINMNTDS
jgi:hypothetical protein